MASRFTGKWVEGDSDNKEALMKKLGVPEDKIAAAMAVNMGIEMIQDGDNFTMKMLAPNGAVMATNKFSIGVPFEFKIPEGGHPMGELVCSWTDDGKVLHTEATGDQVDFVDDTHLQPNGDLKIVQRSGDVKNTTTWKKM